MGFHGAVGSARTVTRENGISEESQYHRKEVKSRKAFQTRDYKPRSCVCCGNAEHRTKECDKITDVAERKELIVKKPTVS